MNNFFATNPTWSGSQVEVLNSNPNLIVSGGAGTGKTLLACHLAIRNSNQKRVAILIFTKALKTFIQNYLNNFEVSNVDVLYEYEWRGQNYPDYDIIIIDEYQDFSSNTIERAISKSSVGVYIFGDDFQRLYKKTVQLPYLRDTTGFKHIHLTQNFRISQFNSNFINAIAGHKIISPTEVLTKTKPRIEPFKNVDEELDWLVKFLTTQSTYHDIGILVKRNHSYNGRYYDEHFMPFEQTMLGVMEIHEHLKTLGINAGYKCENDESLYFDTDLNINIMTIHSSKGLQFDCVVLPFSSFASNYDNSRYGNLCYVALTRATKEIIITYSGHISDEYSSLSSTNLYTGRVVKKKLLTREEQKMLNAKLAIGQLNNNPGINSYEGSEVVRFE